MSLKDKFNEYKEEKERRDYFRKRNDLYVDNIGLIKAFLSGFILSVILSIVIFIVTSLIHIQSTYFYVVLGAIVGSTVKNISGVSSKQIGVVAAIATISGIVIANSLQFIYAIKVFNLSLFFYSLYYGIVSLCSDLFALIFVMISAYIAYITAR